MKLPDTARQIPGSPDWVDVNGDIYTIDNRHYHPKKIIKRSQHTVWGYKYCAVNYNGKNITKRVHRIVAETFIPNPNNYNVVGHRNNIKSDNRVENLYWTTISENTKKAFDDGLAVNAKGFDDIQSKPVKMFRTSTNEYLGTYGSIGEAARITGISETTISRQAKYKRPVRKEFYFRFTDDIDCQQLIAMINVNRLSKI